MTRSIFYYPNKTKVKRRFAQNICIIDLGVEIYIIIEENIFITTCTFVTIPFMKVIKDKMGQVSLNICILSTKYPLITYK